MIVNSDFEKNIKLLKENNIDLVNTSIDYILDVMRELSIIWQNPKSSYRIKAKDKLPDIVNFSDEMIEEGLEVIVELLKPGNIVFNLKRSIGKKQMLDEFVYSYDNSTYSKFRPLGVVSHISASNVFISCVDSLVSGIITKNSNILKIPRVDNFFPLLFMESLKEVDKKNVIYKNIQLWDFRSGNLEAEKAIKEFSDGIVIWGGEEAVQAYRHGIGIHTKLIEYGPKYSFSVIFRDKDIEKVANACALDVSMWEQAACSSPHVIFVKEEFGEKFTELLYKSLEEVNKKYPQKKNDFDTQTEILKWRKILETNAVLNNGKEFHKKGENFSAYYIKNSIFENSFMFRNVIVKTFENQQDI
ncbi:MAG: aldehyde dehydrogenase family protein, partial [Candidatus Muiribacteriota bacterium]